MGPDTVRLSMAILIAVMIELGSSLLLDIAAIGRPKGAPEPGKIEGGVWRSRKSRRLSSP